MKSLMITIKWKSTYGYDETDIIHINHMKTKDFVLIKKDNEYCSTKDLILNYKDMLSNPEEYFNETFQPKIVVGECYFYQDRMFCRETFVLNKFIKKVKTYYEKKTKKL